ncbi:MAG: metal-dependent hydrolase [Sulfurovum sp.]
MALFIQHVNVSVIASGVIIVPLHSAGMLSSGESMLVLGLGVIGGMLPDLDANNSTPTGIMFRLSSIFLPLLILLSIHQTLPILYIILIWGVASFALNYILFEIFLKLTTHRGIFHTIPMGVLFGEVTILISQNLAGMSATFSSIAGFFVFFGFLSHLILDEIYSIDFKAMKLKSSLGTAFKFYDTNNGIGTFFLYILVIYIYTISPIDIGLYNEMLEVFLSMRLI